MRTIALGLGGLLILGISPAYGQQAPSVSPLVAGLVEAVNSDDEAAMRSWVTAHRAAEGSDTAEEILGLLKQVAASSDDLTIVQPTRSSSLVGAWVQTPQGRRGAVRLRPSKEDPDKFEAVVLSAAPRPYPRPLLDRPATSAELTAAITDRIDFAVASGDFSGVVLVMKDDRVILSRADGDTGAGEPMSLSTRFHTGSMGKMFTAVAIGQLMERGALRLDTTLAEILPDYPNRDFASKVTIGQLLNHTAGLGGLFERASYDNNRPYEKVGDLLPSFAADELRFQPGEGGLYSNEGFIVLGAVIEKLSGESYYDYVQREIFARAGMKDTAFDRAGDAPNRRAVGMKFDDADPLGLGRRRPNTEIIGYRGNSCGGVFSTAEDMLRFLHALKAGKLTSSAMAEQLTTKTNEVSGGYALGFQVRSSPGGRTIRGHSGGGPHSGINADARLIWENGYAYAVLGNYDSPFAQTLGRDIADMLASQE
ncbi:serine hydrolase [Caulobacter sp. 17J80-11]|uniref:serine hydrolase domain-containing protein n=1 Tax=Caulobacter sp. 17J80-11 TaxID=2763502 RepID=UPI001653EBEF|nr:serine hydrolase domain-containing protein [Caulobacter sp. 17J80-11]MBC6981472.1 beta-lactamase family protein [Caulobacter sp. 17J80-11]